MRRARKTRLWSIAIVLAIAATALIIALVVRPDEENEDHECLSVPSSLSELVLSRPSVGPLQYAVSLAVEEVMPQGTKWEYENYYVIPIQFSTTDGAMHEGVWELGTNGPGSENGSVSVGIPASEASESIISINGEAQSFTLWPSNGAIADPLSEDVIRTRTCLMEFTTATL